jgi:lipoprotein-anchoring transpeptidase ErfK/SrfK
MAAGAVASKALAAETAVTTGRTMPRAKASAGTPEKPLPILDRTLRAGQYEWRPDLAPQGSVVFIVSLPDQLCHVYRNGVRIGVSTCSTGKAGHRTPAGVFVILQKNKDHKSNIYNNAPMPNMQRLTWTGIALHAGNLPGYPASHGCVRLPKKFSELIFSITSLGIPVIIADAKTQPEVVVHSGFLLPAQAQAQAAAAMTEAAKLRAPKDVLSAVVSAADRKAIALMDGKVIWESEIDIVDPRKPFGESAFTLLGPAPEGGTYRWMANKLDGSSREVIGKRDEVLARIKVKKIEDQRQMLASAKGQPTLVVTDRQASLNTRTDSDFVIADALVS